MPEPTSPRYIAPNMPTQTSPIAPNMPTQTFSQKSSFNTSLEERMYYARLAAKSNNPTGGKRTRKVTKKVRKAKNHRKQQS